MSKKLRFALWAAVVLMLLSLPFLIPSGSILAEYQSQWIDWAWSGTGMMRFLLPSANAEEVHYELPIDFSPGNTPNPAAFTEDGYADDSICVRLETRKADGVTWRLAFVSIQSPTQLRTGIAGTKVTSSRTKLVSVMAKEYNAVIAISGDYYSNDPAKTSFEYRMGTKIRNKSNKKKDILIIDENGDFHTFVKSDKAKMDAFNASGHRIINAFTFGPALVSDGTLLTCDTKYGYNPNEREPRMAIGQLDTLSYVLILAEGRTEGSKGATHQQMADFAFDLGCIEAFNLDGGNTATMVFNGGYYQQKTVGNERDQSDIIYFASAVPPENWSN